MTALRTFTAGCTRTSPPGEEIGLGRKGLRRWVKKQLRIGRIMLVLGSGAKTAWCYLAGAGKSSSERYPSLRLDGATCTLAVGSRTGGRFQIPGTYPERRRCSIRLPVGSSRRLKKSWRNDRQAADVRPFFVDFLPTGGWRTGSPVGVPPSACSQPVDLDGHLMTQALERAVADDDSPFWLHPVYRTCADDHRRTSTGTGPTCRL